MLLDEASGLVIAGNRAGLRFVRAGTADWFGYPARVDIRVGPFSGSYAEESVGRFAEFREALVAMHDTLSGSASLGTLDGGTWVDLVCDHTGTIAVSARVAMSIPAIDIGDMADPFEMQFRFRIDQTHLPVIIRAIAAEFP